MSETPVLCPSNVQITHKDDVTEVIGTKEQLRFTAEFKAYIREHPGFIADAKAVIAELRKKTHSYKPVEVNGVRGERFDRVRLYVFKITTPDGKQFFVKRDELRDNHAAVSEFDVTVKAQKLLHDVPGVEVVVPFFGFSNFSPQSHPDKFRLNGMHYYVSEWRDDLVSLDDLPKMRAKYGISDDVYNEIISTVDTARKILKKHNYFDLFDQNTFYDIKKRKVVLLDLTLEPKP